MSTNRGAKLKDLLAGLPVSLRGLARLVGTSPASLSRMATTGHTPAGWQELKPLLTDELCKAGVAPADVTEALDELEKKDPVRPDEGLTLADITEEDNMILRKQTLTMQAKKAFGLLRSPFDAPQKEEDVYISPEIRYAREKLFEAAVNGGLLALCGESGSGKTILKRDLITRLESENAATIVIEPYVLGMTSSDRDGKPLRASHIAEAIIRTVAPETSIPSNTEALYSRVHKILKDSSRAGFRHCLVIEEAHDLHKATLKGLKRFWELYDGLKPLLSIILIGQTELEKKLQPTDASVREVVQRCDLVRLPPILDLADFLRFRFASVKADADAIFTPEACTALEERLTVCRDNRGDGVYMGYPLMISNLVIAAMNLAAQVGERTVSADVVLQVKP